MRSIVVSLPEREAANGIDIPVDGHFQAHDRRMLSKRIGTTMPHCIRRSAGDDCLFLKMFYAEISRSVFDSVLVRVLRGCAMSIQSVASKEMTPKIAWFIFRWIYYASKIQRAMPW